MSLLNSQWPRLLLSALACSMILVGLHAVASANETAITAAHSGGADRFVRRPYVAGGLGLTQLEPRSPTSALTIDDNRDSGFHLSVGYDITRFLTAEFYIADLGSADIGFLSAPVGQVDYNVFGASAIAYIVNSRSGFFLNRSATGMQRREGLSLYGRAGIGGVYNQSDVSYDRDHPAHAAFGVGLEYGFGNGIALRTEYMTFDTDAKYFTASLLKRFGHLPSSGPVAVAVVPETSPTPATTTVETAQPYDGPLMFRPIIPPYIYFASNDSKLSAEARAKLDAFVDDLDGKDFQIEVDGHTDWRDTEEYNIQLSYRRAIAVREYLESRGIDKSRLRSTGFGEARPISTNLTDIGRSENRRVEFRLR